MDKSRERRESLVYHAKPKPGKTEVVPTKKYNTQRDLAIAYSPGVAIPCQEIEDNKDNTYKYTNKGNLLKYIRNPHLFCHVPEFPFLEMLESLQL